MSIEILDKDFIKKVVSCMQNEKIIDKDHVECPLYGEVVDIEDCVDIHDVVHRIRIPSILPKKILEIENFREICWNCPHHHFG